MIKNIEVTSRSDLYDDHLIKVNVENRGTEKAHFKGYDYKILVSDLGTKENTVTDPSMIILPNEIVSIKFRKYLEPDIYNWNFEVNPKVEYKNLYRIPESNENNNKAIYIVKINEDGHATVKSLLPTLIKVKQVQKKDIKKIKKK